MANGNLITGGQDRDGLPVVAISHGDDLTKWDSILIPYDPQLKPSYAETTVWAEGNHVIAIIRGGLGGDQQRLRPDVVEGPTEQTANAASKGIPGQAQHRAVVPVVELEEPRHAGDLGQRAG